MKKIGAAVLLAAVTSGVGVAAPASAAPLSPDSNTVVKPLGWWPNA